MSEPAQEPSKEIEKDWAEVLDRLVGDDLLGQKLAYLELSRLIRGFLVRRRASDFSQEWEDLIQEVVSALAQAHKKGAIRERSAVAGYASTVTRNKFYNRLKTHMGHHEDEANPWDELEDLLEAHEIDTTSREDTIVAVRHALEKLPERRRRGVYAVMALRMTYEQASSETGIPLGTLKRDVREALAELRKRFCEDPDDQ